MDSERPSEFEIAAAERVRELEGVLSERTTERDTARAAHRTARTRLEMAEREVEQAFVILAAIIAKVGETPPDHPDRRVVTLTSADMDAAPSQVYRFDGPDGTAYGVRFDG